MTPLQLVLAFFPPDLRPAYLLALVQPVAETVGLAFGAMFLAFCLSLPLGVIAALNLRGARGLLLALGALRAVPDLTLAILCVILFGVGPGAGLAALVIYYAAGTAKMFADLLRTAPQAPLRALRAAGASRLQTALFGLLPLKRADLLAFGAYEFECALRASVIVGAVGGGGLGAELMGALSAMDFHRAATLILALVLLAAVFDALAHRLRRRPRWLLALAPLGLAAAVAYAPRLVSLEHAAHVVAEMWPPELPPDGWAALPQRVVETIWMAGAGTGGAVAAALALGAAGALLGSRFQASAESLADAAITRAIVEGRGEQTERSRILDVARGSRWPSRYSARTLAHPHLERWRGREAELATSAEARADYDADVARGAIPPVPVWAGEAIDLITDRPPAAVLLAALAAQAEMALARAGRR